MECLSILTACGKPSNISRTYRTLCQIYPEKFIGTTPADSMKLDVDVTESEDGDQAAQMGEILFSLCH